MAVLLRDKSTEQIVSIFNLCLYFKTLLEI